MVHERGRGCVSYFCQKKAVAIEPESQLRFDDSPLRELAYCKLHLPSTIKAKQDARSAVWNAEYAAQRMEADMEAARKHFCEGLTLEYMQTHKAEVKE
jgi:hypothetical protein